MDIRAIIDVLNNLTFGELSRLEGRVREVRGELERLGHEEIVGILDEALAALDAADLRQFRRRIHHAVSRLGHLR
ncbi:MAG: hypothetical protein Kow0062_22270 [Acidobacteriota bacterium]|nr:MAG: hypothetical protein D6738_08110 [Acidobacteriota bacterium]